MGTSDYGMMKSSWIMRTNSPAEKWGWAALLSGAAAAFFDPCLAIAPLSAYIITCLTASFLPAVSFFLPVHSRGKTGKAFVALSFDDGPDPRTTPLLLDLLDEYRAKATFFVTGKNIERYPHLIREILARGHDMGNHSRSHDVFLMFRSLSRLSAEIESVQTMLQGFGVVPLAFRPPAGATNPKLPLVLQRHGLYCVNFSCRARDRGNRAVNGMARKILRKIRPDDIILLHDISPPNNTPVSVWLEEVAVILSGLKARRLEIIRLAELIDKPVMTV
ncbi:MAG: polysaccharide deacetylase family protein [Syntrophobacterales bacterium]|jgi:peptidoglycan/xylan/chitin deacetylase (PgdA/CDA1 family)|nr:polysaccharide deacetylase family protein [Syntrophobacterales bacterium]